MHVSFSRERGSPLLYIESGRPSEGYEGCNNLRKRLSNSTGARRPHRVSIGALNTEKGELHPECLSNVEPTISEERIKELKSKGLIEGDAKTWRNWHILNQGQWEDIGERVLPKSEPIQQLTEPYALRKPLQYWGFMRGVDSNITSYPLVWEHYNATVGKVKIAKDGGNNPLYIPALFQPTWAIATDRGGLGYNDCRIFGGWIGLDIDTPTKVKTASEVISIPDTGRLYQKFYMGPYPITMGWTIGSLLKVLTLSRNPGHGIVALKIHNMNADTTINGVADDLLNIALNINDVALQSLEPGGEARVRTVIKGPAMVCAGSLEWPSFVKVASPDTYITKIEEGGELDIELKIEWGRGMWLADEKGLLRMEEGADSVCLKRRRIKEVDEEGFYPTTTSFGGCRMIRLAVHKLLGERWDILSYTCPDPREQLVVEIWTDRSTTPKAVLEYGLMETMAWIKEVKRQISQDVDFDGEDEELRDTWEKIDKYKSLEHRQKLMGGPPTVNLHEADVIPGLKASDCKYLGTHDDVKLVPQAPYSLPKTLPNPPTQDSLEWLAAELQSEEYEDASTINAKSLEQFLPKPDDSTWKGLDVSALPVNPELVANIRLCGLNTLGEIASLTEEELSRYPNVTKADAKTIFEFIKTNMKGQ